MSKVCLNSSDAKVIALIEESKKNFTNFTDSQIRAVGSLYFQKYNELPNPKELLDFYANLQIQSNEEKFNQTEVSLKEDVLDLLQGIFFKGLNIASKGSPLTLKMIKENQDKILATIPKFLEVNKLYSILENYEKEYKELLLKSRLKPLRIEFDTNIEDSEFQGSKDNQWDKDSTLLSTYQTASDDVVYLFASLTSDALIKKVNKPLNFKKSWDQTQILLANTTDLPTQISLLRLSDLPFKEQILNKLGYGDFNDLGENGYSEIRTSFFQSFAKSNVNFSKSLPGKQSIDSGEEALMQTIQSEWKSNFLASDYAKIVNNKRVTNPDKIEELKDLNIKEFLEAYGIKFTEWNESLEALGVAIKTHSFNKEVLKNNNISWFDESKEVTKALKDLLRYEANLRKKDSPLGARNAEGKYQHGVMLHSYLSRKISNLKQNIIDATNEFESLFSKGAAGLNIDQGMISGDNAKGFNALDTGDLYCSIISDMFSSQPCMHLPRTSDKSSEQSIKLFYNSKLAGTKTIKEYHNENMAYTEIGDHLYKRLFKQYKGDFVKKTLDSVGWTARNNKAPIEFWNEALNINQIPPLTETEFKDKINEYIENQLPTLYADLVKHNQITTTDNGKIKVTFAESFIGPDFNSSTTQREDIENLLRRYIFNSLLYGTEITQFTMGSLTTVNIEEFFKRTAGPIAQAKLPRVDESIIAMIDSQRPSYMKMFSSASLLKVMISKDDINDSSQSKEYNKIVGQPKAYDEGNTDDAQGKMIIESYREFKLLVKEWTEEQQDAYELLLKNKLTNEKYLAIFPPIKPVASTVINVKGVSVPIYLKTAIYPLHKNLVKGTRNEDLYNKMIENGISIHLPSSGIKLAQPKNLKDQFDKDGNAIFNEEATFTIPMVDFGSQLDIAIKDSVKTLMATQQQKLIASNLFKDGQLQNPEFANWVEERIDTLQEISDIELAKLKDKAGIEMVDNLPVITNYNKLKVMLKDELLNRNLPLNSIDAINKIISEDGQLLATIDGFPNRQKLMNLLNSIVTNKLIKLYTNGSSLVQLAQTGWELKKLEGKPTDEDIINIETSITFINNEAKLAYYKNNGLQFLRLPDKENKKTGAAEILLPAKFKKYVDINGNIDERLLVNIGFRIPTQGLNSILHLKVVGFLPIGLDQVVVMPREITIQGGSDFDVDKLNLFVPNSINMDGYKYISSDMDAEEMYKKFLISKEEKENKKINDKLNIKTNIGNLGSNYLDNAPSEYTDEELEEISLDFNISKDQWIQNFKLKQLQNKLIEQTLQVLEHEQSLKSLLTPNSAKSLEDLAEKLAPKKDKLSLKDMFKPKTLVDITTQMFSSKALVGVFASQITHHVLSQQVGLYVKSGRKLYFDFNPNGSLGGVTNINGELITDRLGNQYVSAAVDGAKKPFLFDLGCNLTTGSSFAFFERRGGNIATFVKFLQQPIIQEYLLANQNNNLLSNKFKKSKSTILKEIFKKYGFESSGSEYLTTYYDHTKAKEVRLEQLQLQRNEYGNWDKNIDYVKSVIVEDKYNKLQKFILDDFLFLMDSAGVVSKSIATLKFDTNGPGKDVVESVILNDNYQQFKEEMAGNEGYTLGTVKSTGKDYSEMVQKILNSKSKDSNHYGKEYNLENFIDSEMEEFFTILNIDYDNDKLIDIKNKATNYKPSSIAAPYDRIVTSTLLNVFYKKSAKFTINLYKDLVLLNQNGIIKQVIKSFNTPTDGIVSKGLDEKSSSLLYGTIINYILQQGINYTKEDFFGENTTARQIMSIKQNPSHPLFNNYVISNIFNPEIGNATNMPDIISITNKNIDDKESTYITQAFAEIKKIDKELYDNLIKVSLFQTGVVSSPVSYYQLLPNDVLDIINSSLKKHKEAIKDFDTLVNSLMENIGGTLKNIKRVNYKKGDAEFGSTMQFPFERTQGKEFIHYVKEDKKTKTTEAEGTFRKIGEDTYALMETKNYKKIFYNLTFNAEPISLPNEENDTQEEDEDMNNQSINPEIKSGSTSWNNLSLQEKIKIGKLGIKENEYSSWTEEVQESTLKCNKIR